MPEAFTDEAIRALQEGAAYAFKQGQAAGAICRLECVHVGLMATVETKEHSTSHVLGWVDFSSARYKDIRVRECVDQVIAKLRKARGY
jgi:hypothetical protein